MHGRSVALLSPVASCQLPLCHLATVIARWTPLPLARCQLQLRLGHTAHTHLGNFHFVNTQAMLCDM